jgi:hypothetical protein
MVQDPLSLLLERHQELIQYLNDTQARSKLTAEQHNVKLRGKTRIDNELGYN